MYTDDDDLPQMLGHSSSVTPSRADSAVLKGICNQM